MHKHFLGASVAIAMALSAALPAHADDKDITIGFAIAKSGWMTANDGPPAQGALMAIDDINAKGGLLGKKLKAIFADTKSDQTEGAKAGQAVIADGANFMVVSCDYDMGAGAATVGNAHKMVTFSLCASDAKMGVQGIGPYAFTIANSSMTIGASLAYWAWTKKSFKNAYLLIDNTVEYNKSTCGGFRAEWKKLGGNMVGEDSFKQDDPSIASQITRFQQADSKTKIDFMMICSYGAGDISAIKQFRAAGINTPIGGADSMDGDFWATGIPNLTGHYASTVCSPFGDDPRPFDNEFVARFEKIVTSQGGNFVRNCYAISGYSVIEAFALAIQRAGSIDNDKVLSELNKFKDEKLAVGPTTFTPELHVQLTRPQVIEEITNGKGHFDSLVQLPEPLPLQLVFKGN